MTRLARPLILAALAGLAACAIDIGEDGVSDVEAVRTNAGLALQQCGEGRVASVDKDGFACKGAGE